MKPHRIEWIDQTGSTNTDLRERLRSAFNSSTNPVVATANQTSGRGRAGRTWSAGGGDNLCFSFFVETRASLNEIPSLGMAACLGVDDGLRELGVESHPKWPNDVLVGDAKICGILCETYFDGGCRGAIVGIGINVNMDRGEAERIDQSATSILIETGRRISPRDLLSKLLPQIEDRIEDWRKFGFAGFREDFSARCLEVARNVEVRHQSEHLRGILIGFGDSGECMLKLDDGSVRSIWCGDVY